MGKNAGWADLERWRGSVAAWVGMGVLAVVILTMSGAAASAEEKRTILSADDFHWQGNLKPGQTLEVITGRPAKTPSTTTWLNPSAKSVVVGTISA